MTTKTIEKKGFLIFGIVLGLSLVVVLTMIILIFTKMMDLASAQNLEKQEYVETTTYAWLTKKLIIWGILLFATISIGLLEWKIRKNFSLKKINTLAILLSIISFLVIIVEIATTNSLDTLNKIQQNISFSGTWKFQEIDISRDFAYVINAFNVIFIIGFGLAITALLTQEAHLRSENK